MDVAAAYRHCEQVTWSQARNFSYGIRLLPPPKRQALAAVYAFARRIDDIGDGSLPSEAKLAALAEARASVTALQQGRGLPAQAVAPTGRLTRSVDAATPPSAAQVGAPSAGPGTVMGAPAPGTPGSGPPGIGHAGPGTLEPGPGALEPSPLRLPRNGQHDPDGASRSPGGDPVLVALADAARRFEIPLAAFGELIDGCEADVRGTTYDTFDDLLHYCRCVAGSIGRLSLGVFGTADVATAAPLADALGVALQLTNILRDIREDYAGGRVYLPAEDFERFGFSLEHGLDGGADESVAALVRFEAQRARDWYARGLALIPMLDRRSAACTGAMAGIYYRLLGHIASTPGAVLTRRLSLSTGEKAAVAAKSLVAALAPQRGRGAGAARPGGGDAR